MASFHLPKSKCEKVVAPKGKFHKASFRWVERGANFLMVGCPKMLDRGGKLVKTKWVAGAAKGCRVASTGAKAGTRVHAIVRASRGGKCKTGKLVRSRSA